MPLDAVHLHREVFFYYRFHGDFYFFYRNYGNSQREYRGILKLETMETFLKTMETAKNLEN